jgi:hypothetical protein
MSRDLATVLDESRSGSCPACRGEGTYRMGCALAVCHVCRGRGDLRAVEKRAPSISRPNGEKKLRAIAVLIMTVLACSGGTSATSSSDAEGEAGRAPYRGPAGADAMPDAVSVPDFMPVLDTATVPDAVQTTEEKTVPIWELPVCVRGAGAGHRSCEINRLYWKPANENCTTCATAGFVVNAPCLLLDQEGASNCEGQASPFEVIFPSCAECPQ